MSLTEDGLARPQKARWHLNHMHHCLAVEREKLGRSLSADEQKGLQRSCCAEFVELPDATRAEATLSAAAEARTRKRPTQVSTPEYNATGDALWGLSSVKEPLRQDVAEQVVKNGCGR